MTAITYLVNPYSGVIHLPRCLHARDCIPWVGFAATLSDRPCSLCLPDGISGDPKEK